MAALIDSEIRSTTDLQRHTREVLDSASERIVVIPREQKDDIALVKHSLARRAFAAFELTQRLHAVFRYVTRRLTIGATASCPSDFEWLSAFDDEDVVDFGNEFADALLRIVEDDRPISEVNDVLEQWRRSAMVLQDTALRERLEQERSILLEGGK
ncbi:MAG TPA: hypothetical protein VGX96_01660 [Candidatus Elarobacter sp.]|nr:hypothetical protein [Candidatus Elarobacter sp.]